MSVGEQTIVNLTEVRDAATTTDGMVEVAAQVMYRPAKLAGGTRMDNTDALVNTFSAWRTKGTEVKAVSTMDDSIYCTLLVGGQYVNLGLGFY